MHSRLNGVPHIVSEPDRMHLRVFLLALPVMAAAAPAAATLYLCKDPAGGTVYQSEPCPPDQLIRSIEEDTRVNVLPSAPPPPAKPAPKPARVIKEAREAKARAAPGHPEERRFLREGMDEAEVLLKVGPPNARGIGPAPSGRGKAKRWIYMPAPGDADTITTVMFQQGKVVAVERKVSR